MQSDNTETVQNSKIISPLGVYNVVIYSEDRAENASDNRIKDKTIEFVVDKTAPVVTIAGIEDERQYMAEERLVTIDVKDNMELDAMKISGQGKEYPADARLCACVVGRFCIHNFRISEAGVAGFERVDVRQGYAKCCTCVVDGRSVMTSDPGIARACRECGLNVLEIRPGYIELEGFDYGFIGGASFKLSADELAFTGRLDAHPDFGAVMDFLAGRGVGATFLTGETAFDVGSVLPLTER